MQKKESEELMIGAEQKHSRSERERQRERIGNLP